MEIIDSHCHVYPHLSYFLKENTAKIPAPLMGQIGQIEKLEHKLAPLKEMTYQLMAPSLEKVHRFLPRFNNYKSQSIHFLADKIYAASSLATPLNCGLEDLMEQMNEHHVSKSLIIAHPPFISNDFVLESARLNPRLKAVVNIPKPCAKLGEKIKLYKERGAVALKIHAAASGLNPNSSHHKNILKYAKENDLPVIIHTGALEIKPFYQVPANGHAELFEQLIETVDTPIILAHMNIHFPDKVMHLINKYDHVYTDTSWQNSKTILKAIKKCGANKILFGTDWPIVGNNFKVNIERILDLKEDAQISNDECEAIFANNAKRIFKLY